MTSNEQKPTPVGRKASVANHNALSDTMVRHPNDEADAKANKSTTSKLTKNTTAPGVKKTGASKQLSKSKKITGAAATSSRSSLDSSLPEKSAKETDTMNDLLHELHSEELAKTTEEKDDVEGDQESSEAGGDEEETFVTPKSALPGEAPLVPATRALPHGEGPSKNLTSNPADEFDSELYIRGPNQRQRFDHLHLYRIVNYKEGQQYLTRNRSNRCR